MEGTIVSLSQSETLNWICLLNFLCNSVGHIGSSVPVWATLPLQTQYVLLFLSSFLFPLPVFLSLVYFSFLFFPMFFYLLVVVSPDPLLLKMLGCVVSADLMGLLEKSAYLLSQRNTLFVDRSHIMIVMMLEASMYWPPWFWGWEMPKEAIFPL